MSLTSNEFDVLLRLYESRSGRALFMGERAKNARRLCFKNPPLCGGYEMGNDSFVASITPAGSLFVNERLMAEAA
jgi:hypothetical protein